MAASSRAVNTSGVSLKVFQVLFFRSTATKHSSVENENHCDFKKLRSLLIRTHMLDLISTTEESHYENYRQQQMETRKFGEPKVKKLDNPKFKEEEEQLRKRFTEQVKAEEARFRQWEQHVRCASIPLSVADVLYSSLRSEIVSTRTWRVRTVPSSLWRRSWTTFRLGTVGARRGDDCAFLLFKSVIDIFLCYLTIVDSRYAFLYTLYIHSFDFEQECCISLPLFDGIHFFGFGAECVWHYH